MESTSRIICALCDSIEGPMGTLPATVVNIKLLDSIETKNSINLKIQALYGSRVIAPICGNCIQLFPIKQECELDDEVILDEQDPFQDIEPPVTSFTLDIPIKAELEIKEEDNNSEKTSSDGGDDCEPEATPTDASEPSEKNKCASCDKFFLFKTCYQKHMQIHRNLVLDNNLSNDTELGERYACTKCDAIFMMENNFKKHILIHEKPQHLCKICNKKFRYAYNLLSHKKFIHNPIPEYLKYECSICQMRQVSKNALLRHLKQHITCKLCSKDFLGNIEYQHHLYKDHDGFSSKCPTCFTLFKCDSKLESHFLRKHAEEKTFKCELCPKAFRSQDYLTVHMKNHSIIKPFLCDRCDKSYRNMSALNGHKLSHGEKTHTCGECSKSFYSLHALKQHRQIHADLLVCHLCSRTFSQVANLQKHLESHENQKKKLESENASEKPHKCHICYKRFKHNYLLVQHINIHTSKACKMHKCSICPKEFKNIQNLQDHEGMHNGVKKYQCKICDKRFTYYPALANHMKSKTLHEKYTCTTCDVAILGRFNYERHLGTHEKEAAAQ